MHDDLAALTLDALLRSALLVFDIHGGARRKENVGGPVLQHHRMTKQGKPQLTQYAPY